MKQQTLVIGAGLVAFLLGGASFAYNVLTRGLENQTALFISGAIAGTGLMDMLVGVVLLKDK